jgi:endonuclease/exonuclease/phosphatase family metal-dependent hydrolase
MLKVASYNIRKSVGLDWKRQPDRILEVIAEVDADIIALQEVDRRFGRRTSSLSVEHIVADTAYFPVRFGSRPSSLGWHGNTILVRKGAKVLLHKQIQLPALEPRGAVMADIEIAGLTVRVIGMHLGLVGLWRRRQAAAVLQYLEKLEEKLPTVFMGDLNQWSTEGGALAHFAETHNIVAPGPSFHASRPLLPLDRIITDLDFIVVSAGVHSSAQALRASDHLPVWATLRVAA